MEFVMKRMDFGEGLDGHRFLTVRFQPLSEVATIPLPHLCGIEVKLPIHEILEFHSPLPVGRNGYGNLFYHVILLLYRKTPYKADIGRVGIGL